MKLTLLRNYLRRRRQHQAQAQQFMREFRELFDHDRHTKRQIEQKIHQAYGGTPGQPK